MGTSDRDIILLKMIEVLDYAAYISGIDGIQFIELQPVELGYRLYLTGFKIEKGQPLVHIKHIKQITLPQEGKPFLLNPDMDTWMNAEVMDAEMILTGIDKLYSSMRTAKELHVLQLSYNKTDNQEYKTIIEPRMYIDKRTACKDAMAFRRTTPCKFNFTCVGRNADGKLTTEHKMTDLEFATAALEE